MKKLTTLLMALMLMSAALWAEETITVSANSSDISEGLDLKVVAKLFAEAKNLEEFETMLNNPDSAFCNLDLNGDGQVDYLRVVETGEGNKRLIVLQAILAKDIYQDVASIYIERDEASNDVSVQVVGDEYVYGTNYIIEPVYVYRPVIYDWFWSDVWFAWHSPWYWGYWPGWWYAHNCWAHDWYWHHCYTFHHYHHGCSFRHGHHPRNGYHELHRGVSRSDYARTHANQSFSRRNSGMTNAREVRSSNARSHQVSFGGADRHSVGGERVANGRVGDRQTVRTERTFGSTHTAVERSGRTNQSTNRPTRTANDSRVASTTRTANDSRTASTTRTTGSNTSHSSRSTSATVTRPTRSTSATISTPTRSTSNSTIRSSGSSSSSVRSSGSSSSSVRISGSSSSSSSTRSSGTYSGGSRSSGSSSSGSYGGGRVSGSSGGGSRSSGGSHGGGGSAGGGRRR